jgi:hypothetical protein
MRKGVKRFFKYKKQQVLELLGMPSLLIGSKNFRTFIQCPKINMHRPL